MFLVALLITVSSVAHQAPGSSNQTTSAGPKTAPQRKICQKLVSTGSIMSRQICKTAEEWDQERSESQRAMQGRALPPKVSR